MNTKSNTNQINATTPVVNPNTVINPITNTNANGFISPGRIRDPEVGYASGSSSSSSSSSSGEPSCSKQGSKRPSLQRVLICALVAVLGLGGGAAVLICACKCRGPSPGTGSKTPASLAAGDPQASARPGSLAPIKEEDDSEGLTWDDPDDASSGYVTAETDEGYSEWEESNESGKKNQPN